MDDERASGGQHVKYLYWAFISYSSTDKSWARWLQRAIESYGVPARLVQHHTPTGEPAPKRLRPLFRDRSELAAAADRVQRTIARTSIYAGARKVTVTASLGATLARADDDPESLLRRADALLYSSKASGRNRSSVS